MKKFLMMLSCVFLVSAVIGTAVAQTRIIPHLSPPSSGFSDEQQRVHESGDREIVNRYFSEAFPMAWRQLGQNRETRDYQCEDDVCTCASVMDCTMMFLNACTGDMTCASEDDDACTCNGT